MGIVQDQGRQLLLKAYIATGIIHLPPLFLYEFARWRGTIPSAGVWRDSPWWNSGETCFMSLSLLAFIVLPAITLMLTVVAAHWSSNGKVVTLLAGVALLIFQVFGGASIASKVAWTIL
jgi:hypothetical protein